MTAEETRAPRAQPTAGPWRLDDHQAHVGVDGQSLLVGDYHAIDAGSGYYVGRGDGFCLMGHMSIENARLISAAPALLEAAHAQEHAEDSNANCPECESEGDWAKCGACSLLFGHAIDLRRAAIVKAEGS